MTEYTTSADGTRIAFDRYGRGPGIIFVGGAMQFRAVDEQTTQLAQRLADLGYSAIVYDRRGRGDSDTADSYTLSDEIADLDALARHFATDVALYGSSSGGAIVLAAAAAGVPATKLALWEVPLGEESGTDAAQHLHELGRVIAAGDNTAVIRLFMSGMPPEWIEPALNTPEIVAMAPSLAADADALAWTQSAPHNALWGGINQPTLVLVGDDTLPMMPAAAEKIRAAVPNAQLHTIQASGHGWNTDVMSDALHAFLRP